MSAEQYKKVLSIAEALLRKVDMPVKTVKKYEILKTQILNDPMDVSNDSGNNEILSIQNQINIEIIDIHQLFISTITEIFNVFLTKNQQTREKSQKFLSKFFNFFQDKKRDVRDLVVEASVNVESRLALKHFLNDIDQIEAGFENFVNLLGGFQDTLLNKLDNEQRFLSKIDKLEDELDETSQQIKGQSGLVQEVELLQIEKKANLERIQSLENLNLELKDGMKKMKQEHELKVAKIEDERNVMLKKITELEEVENKFCEELGQYSSAYQGPQEISDFEKMVNFACELIQKLDSDNRWLQDKAAQYEEEIDGMNKTNEEFERMSVRKKQCVGDLLEELGEIVASSDRTHADLRIIHDEYRILVGGGEDQDY